MFDPVSAGRRGHAFSHHSLTAAIRLALCAVPLTAAAPVLAQQGPSAVMPEIRVQASAEGNYLVQYSNTATKSDTLLLDTPQAITIISKELIRDQAMRGMADAVRYVPGVVTAQGEGNRDTAVFRGNSSTADFFVDGMRDDVQYFRDFYNTETVEVLKGPNAMLFGRGGAGGVINRVLKQPDWRDTAAASLALGPYGSRRASIDVGGIITPSAAFRVNAMLDQAGSFRQSVQAHRSGINPTFSYRLNPATRVVVGVEHFKDERTADRGIPSYLGRPIHTDPSTFFGNAAASTTWARMDALSVLVEHDIGAGSVRNRSRYADYDKFYQNVFPGAVNAAGTMVAISAYNNATARRNFFNQTDLNWSIRSGAIVHKIATGIELGSQVTDNVRHTGYFPSVGPTATSITVATAHPVTTAPVLFKQSATDANNHGTATVASLYLQDQLELTPQWQAIVGLRYDRFKVDFLNKRSNTAIAQADAPLSPRLGLLYKPAAAVSLYGSYSIAYAPRAGEQLAALTATNQAFKPEQFRNHELGIKWDPNASLALTAALYRLRRSNVVIADPADVAKSILVDGQQTRGLELGVTGNFSNAWSVMGGYAYQDATISRTLSATAPAGARLAQVPKHALSWWNRVDFLPAWGGGLGLVYRGDMFASTSNTVRLPGFTRIDAALYYKAGNRLRLQLNLENAFNRRYFAAANSNDNISPGAPRAARLTLAGSL